MITEKQLHLQICTYLKLQYPNIIFITDASGIRVSIGEATRLKKLRSDNGIPDIIIFQPNVGNAGLFLEVKAKSPYKKDGCLYTDAHLREQWKMIVRLNWLGYKALFVWNFEMAKKTIDNYMQEI